jgi:hypothetical protein
LEYFYFSTRDAEWVAKSIAQWMDNMPEGSTPNWVVGFHLSFGNTAMQVENYSAWLP